MPFTDRFMEVPIQVYSQKNADLTGKEDYEDGIEKIDPFQIRSYYKNLAHDDTPSTTVIFKDGGSLLVYLSMQEFENRLNKKYSDK